MTEYYYGFDCFWDWSTNTIKMCPSRKTDISHRDSVTITKFGAHVFVEGTEENKLRQWVKFIIGQQMYRYIRGAQPFRYEDCHTRMGTTLPPPEWLEKFELEDE